MPYFIGMILFTVAKWLVNHLGKRLAYFAIYTALFFTLCTAFFTGMNSALETISSHIGIGFSELNAMLPSGLTTVLSFYFSAKAVMWSFLAQYKYMNMKKIFLR